MSLFSFSFFVFLCVGVLVYYLLPGRWQWVCLLCSAAGSTPARARRVCCFRP